jgi:hypothetical protein
MNSRNSSKGRKAAENALLDVAPEEERLPYTAPDFTVHKVQMESAFLVATSMMKGTNRIDSEIDPFDQGTPTDNGDITLITQ